jgi:hypothetical protein
MKRMVYAIVIAALAAGCGGDKPYEVAEVSGQVLLDGQPLSDARVLFRPVAPSPKEPVGPDAFAKTDAEGRFTMRTVFDEHGATVGRNLVSITTLEVQENSADPDNGRLRQVISPEKVPPRYNRNSELYYEVGDDGDDGATFHLQSR